jgi:hypothetical protein
MPRRSQEAEDEAFAKALQDEYRRDFIRRQEERNENYGIASPTNDSDRDRDSRRNRSTDDSGKRKKKKKGEKGEKKKSKNRKKSRDGETTGSENPRQRRAPPVPAPAPIPVPIPPPLVPTNNQQYSAAPPFHADGDEAYARQVEAELRSEEKAERQRARQARKQRAVAAQEAESLRSAGVTDHRGLDYRGVPKTASFQGSNASDITAPSTDDDEAVAKRIQQELADAEYAERICNLEREETASREVVQSIQRQQQLEQARLQQMQEAPQKSCIRRWGPIVVCLAIAITLPLLYVFGVFDLSVISDISDTLGDIFEDDWNGNVGPASNMTFVEYKGILVPRLPSDAIAWANTGSGLRLDILNACSNDWVPIISTAIANWENGNPVKSLSLYPSKVAYDLECTPVDGKMKVCNGDYGDTRWRGLNEVMMTIRRNTIVTSTAKLNEFYLNYEGEAQKLYTACHEIGHGFGLPHWDEDFGNKDLGNCMDYTYNPGENGTPDKSNFLYLAQLYGGQQVSTKAELTAEDVKAMIDDKLETQEITTQKVNGVRNLFGIGGSSKKIRGGIPIATIPLSESRLKIDHTIPGGPTPTRRLLHADESAEIHVYESPDYPGLRIYQHFLLVGDEEYQ